MPNIFDGLLKTVFNTTTKLMGYDAEWQPHAGGALQTARVHYKKPNEVRVLDTAFSYNAEHHTMEYLEGAFVGLFESKRAGVDEYVTIEGTRFYVEQVVAYWDGKTLVATLSPAN